MKYPRFATIPQQVFPNQRNDEKILVLSRRHWINFAFFAVIIAALFIAPVIALFFLYGYLRAIAVGNNLLQDILILGSGTYFLVLEAVLLTAWISYYYNIFAVTSERVVEITQRGLFNRETRELFFEQIEDVTCKTKGIIYTLLNVGDLEIETAGPALNFKITQLVHPQAIAEIIHDHSSRVKQSAGAENGESNLPAMGMINEIKIPLDGNTPAIMNLKGELGESKSAIKGLCRKPRTLREKIDFWWIVRCSRILDSLEYSEENGGNYCVPSRILTKKHIGGKVESKPPSLRRKKNELRLQEQQFSKTEAVAEGEEGKKSLGKEDKGMMDF